MNILLVLNSLKDRKEFLEKHDVLIRHAENWVKNGNSVIVISNITETEYQKPGIKFIFPPDFLFTHLFVSIWFSIINHQVFDLVIEEVALTPFYLPKTRKILYLGGKPNNGYFFSVQKYLEKLLLTLIKVFEKDSFFMVSNWSWNKLLKEKGIKEKNTFLLKEGMDLENMKNSQKRPGKNLLFIETNGFDEVGEAIEVFKIVERRDLDWKFTIIIDKDLVSSTREKISESLQNSVVKIVEKDNFQKTAQEIKKAGILLNMDFNEISLNSDILTISLQKPVITCDSDFLKTQKDLEKNLFVFRKSDFEGMAKVALELMNQPGKYVKKLLSAKESAMDYSWNSVSLKSFRFLETIHR